MMVTVTNGTIRVRSWVMDIESFRRWMDAEDFPEQGRIWWLCGDVWADMSKEQIFTHIAVKTEYTAVLHNLAKKAKLGMVLGDGLLLSNFAADRSVKRQFGRKGPDHVETGLLGSRHPRVLDCGCPR